MKSLILTVILLFGTGILLAQDQPGFDFEKPEGPGHKLGDVLLAVSGNHITANSPYESAFGGGIQLKVYAGKRFSFDTDLVFGTDYVHLGPGIFGLPLWILGSEVLEGDEDEDFSSSLIGFLVKGALMLLSAERFSYHHPLSNSLEISPYASLLRIKMISGLPVTENNDGFENHSCAALGVELNKYYNNWVVSPFVDYNISYNGDVHGVNVGIYVGYYFGE